MPQDATIEITIDPSLLDHFTENLNRLESGEAPENAITDLIATILDGSEFPVTAERTGTRKIRIGYRLRSFSEPFF